MRGPLAQEKECRGSTTDGSVRSRDLRFEARPRLRRLCKSLIEGDLRNRSNLVGECARPHWSREVVPYSSRESFPRERLLLTAGGEPVPSA